MQLAGRKLEDAARVAMLAAALAAPVFGRSDSFDEPRIIIPILVQTLMTFRVLLVDPSYGRFMHGLIKRYARRPAVRPTNRS